MVATIPKTAIWAIRFVQWIFAVIILAVSSYFVHQFHIFFSRAPRETVVPLVFSVLAIIFTSAALIGLFFLNYAVQLLSAVLDFILWIGFLTSAGLLRHNYHILGRHNLLLLKLYYGRRSVLQPPHWFRNSSLVRLLAASVVIEVYFIPPRCLYPWVNFMFWWISVGCCSPDRIANLGWGIKDIILYHNAAAVICGKEVSRREASPRDAGVVLQDLAISSCQRSPT